MDIPDDAMEYMNRLLPPGEQINVEEARDQNTLLEAIKEAKLKLK